MVGLEPLAAHELFSEFLTDTSLTANQIHFVNLIVDYVIENGLMVDRNVLQQEPFRSVGNIVQLFDGDRAAVRKIMAVVDEIETNAKEVIEG